jgi:predicted permease
MVTHFIKRDFKSNSLAWIIVGVLTAGAGVLTVFWPSFYRVAIPVLGYAYFFLGLAPMQGITGAKFRTQHLMSRNYLLSLPVNRKRQFAIMQLRALIYWIPLIILVAALPFVLFRAGFERIHQSNQLLYLVLIMSSVLWIINRIIIMQVTLERITSYQTQKQRFFRWIGDISLFVVEILIVNFSWFGFIMLDGLGDFAVVMVVAGLAVWRYNSARQGWL